MISGTLQLLGTGGSLGVPVVGCHCEVCRSSNPKNRRLRSASLLTVGNKRILIDAGTDLRTQALTFGVEKIDALLITHPHQDHVGGMDDLRAYFFHHPESIPCYLSESTYNDLKIRFHYMFDPEMRRAKLVPNLDIQVLDQLRGQFTCVGVPIRYFTFWQVGMPVNGYRIGDIAYLSDIKEYSDSIFEDLQGVQTLVISALRFIPAHMHFTIDDAVEFANRVGAKRVWLTHMSHELDHDKVEQLLPSHIRLGYDGLVIPFTTPSSG